MLLQSFIRALIRVNFFTISQAACSSSTRDMQLVAAVTTLIRLKWPNHNRNKLYSSGGNGTIFNPLRLARADV